MKIHEYQAKNIFRAHGIAVPAGGIAEDIEQGTGLARQLGFPLAVKAQVHAGGRGKAGAIRIVCDEQGLKKALGEILGMSVKGFKVKKVLIEKALDIKNQFYLGVTVDRSKQKNAVIASSEGGIDIEEAAKKSPQKVKTVLLEEADRLEEKELEALAQHLGLAPLAKGKFSDIAARLFAAYVGTDAELAEINPLALTQDGKWFACDAKMVVDDNALFRHEQLKGLMEEAEDNALEAEAHRLGLAYVKLDGDIGIIGNGAGLVMATMDEVKRAGGRPADFLDIGGGARQEVMRNALDIIYMDSDVKAIFINIFGGITRCDEVACGIIEAMQHTARNLPTVLRLAGTNAEEGRRILQETALMSADTMQDGAVKITKLAGHGHISR